MRFNQQKQMPAFYAYFNYNGILYTIVFFLIIIIPAHAAWYSNWVYRKKIILPGACGENLTGFPLCAVISNNSDLTVKASNNGYDILFTDYQGNKLDHEIEYYSNGTLVSWVKMPIYYTGSDYRNDIYMYYDSSQTGNQQNAVNVWTSGYTAVWHFKETNGNIYDSTSNNILGTNFGNVFLGENGAGALCARLDGTDDYFHCGNSNVL